MSAVASMAGAADGDRSAQANDDGGVIGRVGGSAWMRASQARVEAALDRAMPAATVEPGKLHEAMRYATLGGGKRVRAMLVYAAGEWAASGAADPSDDEAGETGPAAVANTAETWAALDAAACAVELIHAYSLVHDDLPAMDDDDMRRGRPTVHVAYDEATALLVGDALQALAFEVLARGVRPADAGAQVALLASASGSIGMAGGQAIDLDSVGKTLTWPALEAMHRAKTGALLRASVLLGANAGAADVGRDLALDATRDPTADADPAVHTPTDRRDAPPDRSQLERYASAVGLAFQVVDDVLDVETDSATLGKTAGKDAMHDKPTVVTTLGLERAKALARALRDDAEQALDALGGRPDRLRDLAAFIIGRSF